MTNKELYEQAEDFGCKIPFVKAKFAKADIPDNVLTELTEALETIIEYKEDFPDELLRGLRELGTNALVNVHKKYSKKWPSISNREVIENE